MTSDEFRDLERNPWRVYVGAKELKAGAMLAYGESHESRWRMVKFLSISPDGLKLICGFDGEETETLPVGGFEGVTVKHPAGTIDLTPTWAAVLPILIESLSNRNTMASAKLELQRMAQAADAYNKYCSGGD